ncbi:hypothetical protein M8A51_13295 [Schlegelella sp. S2-27]|uniref:Uncharacterized protein n=1 Tax=Caldimonas mangrovi TaxID=2944811 RepID=A0ABT0YQ19_9BURK|nr:hypothetical protein [Caldimonas mangrovi]MCM5680504.1 hypothetical protein [Caldimonas mangrovi]
MASKASKVGSMHLIVSDEKNPAVKLKKGMRLEVREVAFNTPELKKVAQASRLCGMGGACMALIDIGADVVNPVPKTAARKSSR